MYQSTLYKYRFHFIFSINIIVPLKLMCRPKRSQCNGPSKTPQPEQRIKIGKYHLHLVKHPENVYAVHLCIESNNLYGYCTGYLSMPIDYWTQFVNAVIPKGKLPRYDVVSNFRSSGLFLVTDRHYRTCHQINTLNSI